MSVHPFPGAAAARKALLTALVMLLAALPSPAGAAAPAGPYQPAWDSIAKHPMPEWLLDAKFGIYAHWGVYSVPAFETEWYGKWMYDMTGRNKKIYQHHVDTYGGPAKFGYVNFVPMFKAEKFDPDAWAELVEAAGARYAGLAVVHHDGFLLWDSAISRWNAKQMGPKRDLYGEYVAALRRRGIKTLATEHHLRTYNWFLPGSDGFGVLKDKEKAKKIIEQNKMDLADPQYADFYWNELAGKTYGEFLKVWQAQVREVMDKYQPDVFWFDGGDFRGKATEQIVLDLLCHYHNGAAAAGKPVEVLNKLAGNGKFNFDENYGILTFEEGRDREPSTPRPWIDDMKISDKGWCYVEGQVYRPAGEILDGLIDRVSRGGGLLLNLSPKADGTIPEEQRIIVLEVGAWLKANGEAIYGTRPWVVAAEGDEAKLRRGRQWSFEKCDATDIRFTQAKDKSAIYAITLGWPADGKVVIKTLRAGSPQYPGEIKEIRLLGSDAKPNCARTAEALVITLPEGQKTTQACAFKISGD